MADEFIYPGPVTISICFEIKATGKKWREGRKLMQRINSPPECHGNVFAFIAQFFLLSLPKVTVFIDVQIISS